MAIGLPKPTSNGTRDRQRRNRKLKTNEAAEKAIVRARDQRCRFPLCGCERLGLPLHVSHAVHKGMGGDPTGDRSVSSLMVLVCAARHRENKIALDKGTLRWEPVTDAGANGPICWWVDVLAMGLQAGAANGVTSDGGWWFLLAEEYSAQGGLFVALDENQRDALGVLAQMIL